MTLLPYDLTFKNPIFIQGHELESKTGLIIKVEKDNILSFADVSPLEHLSTESYKDIHIDCKNIDTNQIFKDIDSYLKKDNERLFIQEKFLDFDFSKYTSHASLKHALSCLFSSHYRKKLGISITGSTHYHGLIPNSLIKAPAEEAVKKALLLEKFGFKKAKIKVTAGDNSLLTRILKETKTLQLRLDANRNLQLSDYVSLLKGVDLDRIDYIEEPVERPYELIEFATSQNVGIAIDENINLLKDVNLNGVVAAVIKPTLIGDFHTLKKLIATNKKRNISLVFSSSFESQVGIFQIAQLAHAVNPLECHGLDTFDCFLENLMDVEGRNGVISLSDSPELKGPLYV